MSKSKVVTIEDRIPKLKQKRKQKANRRLILYLSSFFLMILTVVYFQSPLSKVSLIEVYGNENVSKEEVIKLSKLSNRTSFWKVNKAKVAEVINSHNEIIGTTLTRKFPNSIIITVKELKRVAYILDDKGVYYPVLESGQVLPAISDLSAPVDAPLLLNWNYDNSDVIGIAKELTKLSEGIANSISEIHHTPTETDPYSLRLFMNNGYEVVATMRGFAEKMGDYPAVVSELDPALKGVLYLDVVPYFDQYRNEENTENEGAEESESEG